MRYTIDSLDKKVTKIIKESGNDPRLSFSMYEIIEPEIDNYNLQPVNAPDFTSLFCEGKAVFYESSLFQHYKGCPIENPTWADVIIEANHACRGDHIFLEAINLDREQDGIKYYKFFFGS